jgi:transcriptional regulator with XRE-family HTH domain
MTSNVTSRKSRRGRPPTPLDPNASRAARLGAELRAHREAENLTLQALGGRIEYSAQHISQVERGRATVTEAFVEACDAELGTDGALMRLLPDVILEHHKIRSARVAARRGADLYSEPQDGGDASVPSTTAREIDPTLPDHWNRLLAIFGRHDAAHGAHQLLGTARRELRLITEYRQIARGELRVAFMHIEARWAVYAGWLSEDTGDLRSRTALLERALHLAREADQPDLIAWTRARQAQWSDPQRAIRLAQIGLRTPHASAHTRALCAARAAHAHAYIGDAETTKRLLHEARRLASADSAAPPLAISAPLAEHVMPRWEARC